MRHGLFALATAAALALAAPAFAQLGTSVGEGFAGYVNPSQPDAGPDGAGLPKSYMKKVTDLSFKVLEQRREDGGRLTPEHLAMLQRQFDRLNHSYGLRSSLRLSGA